MKNTRRTLAVVLTFMVLVTGLVSSFNVSAAPAVAYECKLGIDNIKSGQFEFMAYNISDNTFHRLETASKPTWHPDWPGHFVPNQEVYVVSKSEMEGGLVDLMCDAERNWGSAVVFTAPKDYKYNIVAELDKFSGMVNGLVCYVDISLVKGDGTVLLKYEQVEYKEIRMVQLNVQLAEGETVYILVTPNSASTKTSSQNVALMSFLVTEAPQQQQTTDPNNTTANQETTAPDNNGGGNTPALDLDPIIIVSIVGGVLVLTMIVLVIVLRAKKK